MNRVPSSRFASHQNLKLLTGLENMSVDTQKVGFTMWVHENRRYEIATYMSIRSCNFFNRSYPGHLQLAPQVWKRTVPKARRMREAMKQCHRLNGGPGPIRNM